MRKTFMPFFLLFSAYILAQPNVPYKIGEKCSYSIYFGPIEVGVGKLEIIDSVTINKTHAFHIVGVGKTNKFFDLFFKVRDTYETYINPTTLLPLRFIRKVNEGGHIINQDYLFFHDLGFVTTQDTTFEIPNNSQDMLSAFFYARTFKKTDVKKEKSFFVPIFMDDENYSLEISYLYNEYIETKWGNIECMVFRPKMQEGRIFQDGEQMKVWISNDDNHLLMKVETKIWAGTVKAFLTEYSFLKTPLLTTKKSQD